MFLHTPSEESVKIVCFSGDLDSFENDFFLKSLPDEFNHSLVLNAKTLI